MVAEVAMDPVFRLEALFLSPALDTPFRTCTAFCSAWVRSSSSSRSWGLSVHAAEANIVVCHHCPYHCMPEDRPEAALGGGCLRFTWTRGLFISFWTAGWLRSLSWFPAKTQGSKTPAPTESSGKGRRGKDNLGSGRWARPPGPVSERSCEGPRKA